MLLSAMRSQNGSQLALIEKFYGTLGASLGICPSRYCPKLGGLNVIGGH